MELEEFKKQLLIEPDSQDQAFVAARRESVQHMAVAKDSDQFEASLKAALTVGADENLSDEILARVFPPHAAAPRHWRGWLAAVASVTMAVGIGSFLYDGSVQAKPMREAFVEHMGNRHEYPMSLKKTQAKPMSEVREIFHEFGADMSADFGKVTYLTRCKIGGKLGIHLVLTGDSGDKTTVMYLPDEELLAEVSFDVDQVSARMVSTPTGVAALFGHDGQDLSATTASLLQSLGGFGLVSLALN